MTETAPLRWFAIATMGRSGSTMLERLLDSHPQIVCLGEVFHPGHPHPTDSAEALAHSITQAMLPSAAGVLGFKLPWEHVVEVPAAWDALRGLGFRLVHLRRRNKVDHALSIALAQRNNVWWPQGAYSEQSVALDPNWLEQVMLSSEWVDRQWVGLGQGLPNFRIDYEDAIRGIGLDDLQEFLGVDRATMRSGIGRARHVPRRQAITNFDQLREHFAGTRWMEFFLDEEHLEER